MSFARLWRRPSVALLAGLLVVSCGKPDPRHQRELLGSVGQVVCGEDRRTREAGVIALAEAIDDFRPTSPYQNRRMAVQAAIKDVRATRCGAA